MFSLFDFSRSILKYIKKNILSFLVISFGELLLSLDYWKIGKCKSYTEKQVSELKHIFSPPIFWIVPKKLFMLYEPVIRSKAKIQASAALTHQQVLKTTKEYKDFTSPILPKVFSLQLLSHQQWNWSDANSRTVMNVSLTLWTSLYWCCLFKSHLTPLQIRTWNYLLLNHFHQKQAVHNF